MLPGKLVNIATRAVQIICVLALTACSPHDSATLQATTPTTAAASFELTASVQELMEAMVDPHADAIWDAVGSTITAAGTQNKQPSNDDEWRQIRLSAIALMETTNLLAMNGRRLVPEGGKILDEGSDGVLKTEEAQKKLESQHEVFAQFAHALHDVGKKVLRAVDAKDPNALLDAGTDLDEVCEGCHTTFWYPGQVLPNPADLLPK
jgi:hypothetical protein